LTALEYNKSRGYTKDEVKAIQRVVGATADGVWGPKTIASVEAWQKANGLVADGKVGPKTFAEMKESVQEDLIIPALLILHDLPPATEKWGYDHLPMVWEKKDPQLEAMTSNGNFEAGLVRLVSGWDGRDFSRGPDSWISLDLYSIGIAHWWSDTAPKILDEICTRCPELAAFAWGEDAAKAMMDPRWLEELHPPKRGKMPHDRSLDWLLAGWYAIARHPDVIRVCVDEWLDSYTPAGIELMIKYRWEKGTTLAGLIRMTNSRGSGGMKSIIRKAIDKVGSSRKEDEVIEMAFMHKDLYDHPERLELIQSWSEFRGDAPHRVSADALDYTVEPQRIDGTIPPFVALGL
jgi:hypothetical protein